ncbi:MAG: epimerase [Bryobacteraceae bacterium]|jgi:uncharacterized protein YbjT (DUF2867 family)
MNVILFGSTGMVGQGVLRECLLDPRVETVLSIVRAATGQKHEKLRELVHRDFLDFSPIKSELTGFHACFFCLGVSSFGMKEADYYRITYEITLAAAQLLAALNPAMTFIYVSGLGTDSTEQGSSMWARVKGKTENALFGLPFKAAYMFRPGLIQPLHGIKSKTALYRMLYAVTALVLPTLKELFPDSITTTEQVGRAMINVARHGFANKILENRDINQAAQ